MRGRACLVAMMLAGVGCQHGTATRPASHEASFTELWETYRHCQKSEDPHEMKVDALHLDQTVQKLADDNKAPLIPDELEQLVLDRPTRLAVEQDVGQ